MKLSFCVFFFISIFSISNSQTNGKIKITYPLAKPTNDSLCWGSKLMFLGQGFWDRNKDKITNVVGNEEYERIKNNSSDKSYPKGSQLNMFDAEKLSKRYFPEYIKKLSELVMYKIGIFNDINSGELAILRVPYQENKNWDLPNAPKWDTVYFIVDNKFTQEIPLTTSSVKAIVSYKDANKLLNLFTDSILRQVGKTQFENLTKFIEGEKHLSVSSCSYRKFQQKVKVKTEVAGYKVAEFVYKQNVFTILKVSDKEMEVPPIDTRCEYKYLMVKIN